MSTFLAKNRFCLGSQVRFDKLEAPKNSKVADIVALTFLNPNKAYMFLFNKAEEENSSLKIVYCKQMNSTSLNYPCMAPPILTDL